MLQHRPSIKYFLELRTDAVDNLLENTGDYTFSMKVTAPLKGLRFTWAEEALPWEQKAWRAEQRMR